MKKVNLFIQGGWLVLFLIIGLSYLNNSTSEDPVIAALFCAFILGINQLVVSLVHVFILGKKSPLKWHFALSFIYLLGLWVYCKTNLLHVFVKYELEWLSWLIPTCLAIYFWYITFTKLNPYLNERGQF